MTDKELYQHMLHFIECSGYRAESIKKELKIRLAQPEPEPVAWLDREIGSAYLASELDADDDCADLEPLYTAPPHPEPTVNGWPLYSGLPQPEPEPVAEVGVWDNGQLNITFLPASDYLQHGDKLYTAPPKKEWVGLTDEEYEAMAEQYVTNCYFDTLKYAHAIEKSLREKNQ